MNLSDIKPGQWLFYTERPTSYYADSLMQVIDASGILYADAIATNWNGEYITRESCEATHWGNLQKSHPTSILNAGTWSAINRWKSIQSNSWTKNTRSNWSGIASFAATFRETITF